MKRPPHRPRWEKWRKPIAAHFPLNVARSGDAVYVRVRGPGNMKLCPTLYDFAKRMVMEGYQKFIIDLQECTTMDSTFMGTLVEVFSFSTPSCESLMIINAQDHCEGLLEGLGLDNVLRIKRGTTELPKAQLEPLPEFAASQPERMKLIRRAHENLVRIDKRNEEKFGPFLRQLAKEMDRLR